MAEIYILIVCMYLIIGAPIAFQTFEIETNINYKFAFFVAIVISWPFYLLVSLLEGIVILIKSETKRFTDWLNLRKKQGPMGIVISNSFYETVFTNNWAHIKSKSDKNKKLLCGTIAGSFYAAQPSYYEGLVPSLDFCPYCYDKLPEPVKQNFRPLKFAISLHPLSNKEAN